MKKVKYVLCVGVGILLYLMAELVDSQSSLVENGRLLRNDCGKGEAAYEFYVDGLEEEPEAFSIQVPERKLTIEQFQACIPEMVELLCERIVGENPSLRDVRMDLNLVSEIPEYGVSVKWKSKNPEIVSDFGDVTVGDEKIWQDGANGVASVEDIESDLVGNECEKGIGIYLEATLTNGIAEEIVEIPIIVYPLVLTKKERFLSYLESLAGSDVVNPEVILPEEFEGQKITYRNFGRSQNLALIGLGFVAAVCLALKEKSDLDTAKRQRESSLMADYPDLVSGFLILTGAGYPAKAAWKKMTVDFSKSKKNGIHPLFEEMQVTVNQMETGTAETRAYADFGRRCGIRCYIKFASLLESNVSTGGKNLRKLLEDEMEEAFKQRADIARRKGEEASSKLLLPMFGMLGVVMVIVVAPAFLTFG